MTDVTIYSPTKSIISENDLYDKIKTLIFAGRKPLSDSAIVFLDLLSKKFLRSPLAKGNPQITALGFWLRKSATHKISENFLNRQPEDTILAPRGITFHLPPANVDTLFVYSWALSFLAGNVNIVRLPDHPSETAQYLVNTIIESLVEAEDQDRHVFCSYDYDNNINELVSSHSDLRMIWGGDEKVSMLSRLPVRPDGISLGFPDRFSYSVVSQTAYENCDPKQKSALIENFYNDLFWFDQMGCGSPRVLYWVGNDPNSVADFTSKLSDKAIEKGYAPDTSVVINKFSFLNEMLAQAHAESGTMHSNALHTMRIKEDLDLRDRKPGGGMLSVVITDSIMNIALHAQRKDQTVTHFGFEPDALRSFAEAISNRGGYRIVPIGRALEFNPIWDGIDLFSDMTRRISVQT